MPGITRPYPRSTPGLAGPRPGVCCHIPGIPRETQPDQVLLPDPRQNFSILQLNRQKRGAENRSGVRMEGNISPVEPRVTLTQLHRQTGDGTLSQVLPPGAERQIRSEDRRQEKSLTLYISVLPVKSGAGDSAVRSRQIDQELG